MIKDFNNVCATMAMARRMEKTTEKVYQFLLDHKGQSFRPKDIAEQCGFYAHYNGHKDGNFYAMTNPLKWLVELGLINKKEVIDEPIEIAKETYIYAIEDGKPATVEIDGITYVRNDGKINKKGHWETVTKIITPHHYEYFIV